MSVEIQQAQRGSTSTAPAGFLARQVTRVEQVPAWALPVAMGVLCVIGTAAVATIDPHTPGRWPTCPSLTLTGFYCPGCGALRTVYSLAHLDFAGAMNMNPLLVLAIPFVVGGWVLWLQRSVTGRSRKALIKSGWLFALAGVVVLYGVLRNVPFFAPWIAPGA